LPYAYRSAGVRFLLFIFFLLCGFATASATSAGADSAPSYLVEKITVTGNRRPASARIVLSESLLREGRSYTEDEVRVAIRRIKRLPFIVEADFALKPRVEGGPYELVLAVEETKPIFADVHFERNTGGGTPVEANLPFPQPNVDFTRGDSLLGLREAVGSTGLLFATVGNSNSLSQAGYTHYGLFGAGSFASVALAYDPLDHRWTPALSAGVALTVNQSLRAAVSRTRKNDESGVFRLESEDRTAELDWLYDTTDDPFFPTRGNAAEATVAYQSFEDRFREFDEATTRLGQKLATLTLSGHHRQPLTERQSLSYGFTGSTYRFTASEQSLFENGSTEPSFGYQAAVEVGHAVDLWASERAQSWGKLRLENTAAYVMASTARNFRSSDDIDPLHQLSLRTALVYRSSWASVRLALLWHGKAAG
jgi:hypothetical protein